MENGERIIKVVAIKDLPEGYFKSRLTSMVKKVESKVIVVAVGGWAHDWAAYIGWPKFDDLLDSRQTADSMFYCAMVSTGDGVAERGDKMSETEARILFPECVTLHYRE